MSSTVSDLRTVRTALQEFIESQATDVRLECLLSEDPGFPVGPDVVSKADTYQACLRNVEASDFMVQLIGKRYGQPDIPSEDGPISILHAEYRTAFRKRIPIFTFVGTETWRRWRTHLRDGAEYDPESEEGLLFRLLEEIEGHDRKRWLFRFDTVKEIKRSLEASLFNYDDSVFVADVTYPDDAEVMANEAFTKIWEIRNNGLKRWEGRVLRESRPSATGLVPKSREVPIPTTDPGESVQIAVDFVAPPYPGGYISYWKMLDIERNLAFPWKKGIWVKVAVLDR